MRLNNEGNITEDNQILLEPNFNNVNFGEDEEQFSAIFAELNEKFFDGATGTPDDYIIGNIENPVGEKINISYEVQPDDPDGHYYCVVINELNGHINMNISPFFVIISN